MYLRKLKVSGFKSFADRLEIEFDQGVTGIVGPNGCGKSNVSDAIRWVLGEQNPRRLRGNQMQDMIFNGTSNRAAAGLAEVSIVFDNCDQFLPINYREVQITRRLYRSGESEYRVNNQKCRLKDVTDLFLDSGVGTNCYSILEQGRVDMIVNAKPAERREIIEEAAGVSRFLNRKMEALRKLDRTEQDLTRIDDILGELQRRKRSLERQAKQAELAKKYRAELIETEYILHYRSGKTLRESMAGMDRGMEELRNRAEALAKELADVRERKNELNRQLQEKDEDNRRFRDAYTTANARLEQMERHLAGLKQRENEYVEMATRMKGECESDRRRMAEETRRIEAADKSIGGLEGEIGELAASVDQLRGQLDQINGEFQAIESEGAEKQKRYVNLEREITELRNQTRLWERDSEHIQRRLGQLREEKARLAEELEAHKAQIEELTEQSMVLEEQTAQLEADLEETSEACETRREEERKLENQLRESEREWQRAHSRLESLRALQANLEGFDEGVRFLLRGDKQPLSDLLGTVAERIQVCPGYERAVESALALKLQAVIAVNGQAIQHAVEQLRERRKGRVAFLPLEGEPMKGESPAAAPVQTLNRVSEFVECDESFRPLVRRLLGESFVVDSLKRGFELRPHLTPGVRLVTLDGDVLEADGTVTGGFSKGSQILDRSAEIARLDEQTEELGRERQRLEKEINEARAAIAELSKRRDELRQTLFDKKNQLKSAKNELNRIQSLTQRQTQSIQALDSENQTLSRELETGLNENEARKKRAEALSSELNELESQITRWQERIETIRETRKARSDEMADAKMALLEKKKDLERWNAERQNAARNLKDLEQDIEEKTALIEEQEERRLEAEKGVEETKAAIEELKSERDKQWEDVQKSEAVNQELRGVIQTAAREEREIGERHDAAREELHTAERERMRLRVEEEYWNKKLSESFSKLENREALEADTRTDGELSEKEAFYRRRLEQLGVVNELAIEEFEEVKERCDFLESQRADLDKSRNDLMATSKELHGATVDLFLKTFEQVRENFNRTFRRIFNGGRAEIRLMEGDPLEAGIEIEVQPPGKKLQSITLLSGGEKAMVAVSLLFAIYEIKPSPFCFLDEIDAPLDDANVGRFSTLVKGFLDRSQFILITHNKKTMEVANSIYGVTMPEEGVSTIYSMKFNRAGRANVAGAAGEREPAAGEAAEQAAPEPAPEEAMV